MLELQSYKNRVIEKDDKILFITRADLIGDYIFTRKFIHFLKSTQKFKDYKIVLCVNIAVKDIALEFDSDYVDEFIFVDFPKVFKNFELLNLLQKTVNSYQYEIAIHYRTIGYTYGDSVIKMVNAKDKIGIEYDKTDKIYTKVYSEGANCFGTSLDKFAEFISGEKLKSSDYKLELNSQKFEQLRFKKPYAVLFPSASTSIKRMDFSVFYEIAKYLSKKGITSYICGSENDNALFEGYDLDLPFVKNICGKYKLSDLFYIFKGADFVVTNETCAVHIAKSVGNYNAMVFCNVYPPVKENLSVEINENYETVYFDKKTHDLYYLYPKISVDTLFSKSENIDKSKLVNQDLSGIETKNIYYILDKLINEKA